jgi:hypothetical protein
MLRGLVFDSSVGPAMSPWQQRRADDVVGLRVEQQRRADDAVPARTANRLQTRVGTMAAR